MSEIKAYGEKIIIKKLTGSDISSGGIVLPKSRHSNWAKVVSVGPGAKQQLLNKAILVHDYAGTEVELDDGVHFVIEESDIVATKEGDSNA